MKSAILLLKAAALSCMDPSVPRIRRRLEGGSDLYDDDIRGYFWSSTLRSDAEVSEPSNAWALSVNEKGIYFSGMPVRPVSD